MLTDFVFLSLFQHPNFLNSPETRVQSSPKTTWHSIENLIWVPHYFQDKLDQELLNVTIRHLQHAGNCEVQREMYQVAKSGSALPI